RHFLESFEAQVNLFPNMMNTKIKDVIHSYKNQALAWKLSGAGGGGYLVMVAEKPVEGTFRVKIRRKSF
ncbi:MAG: cytidyltransferase, partial [Bacteroidales bacterium]